MMNLFGSKKGRSLKSGKKSSRQNSTEEPAAPPNWPSLSPAASMTTLGDCKEANAESPLLETRTSELIPSFAPPLDLQDLPSPQDSSISAMQSLDSARATSLAARQHSINSQLPLTIDAITDLDDVAVAPVNEAARAAELYRQSLQSQGAVADDAQVSGGRRSFGKGRDSAQRRLEFQNPAQRTHMEAALASAERQIERLRQRERGQAHALMEARHQLHEASSASSAISDDCALTPEAASEMASLRRLLEGMRQEMQGLEDELFALREERAVVEMERAAAADDADVAAAALAAANRRQADLVAAVDEARAALKGAAREKSGALAAAMEARDAARARLAMVEGAANAVRAEAERDLTAARKRAEELGDALQAAQTEAAAAAERTAEAVAAAERVQAENEALSKTFNERVDAADRELKKNNEALRADIARHVSHQISHLALEAVRAAEEDRAAKDAEVEQLTTQLAAASADQQRLTEVETLADEALTALEAKTKDVEVLQRSLDDMQAQVAALSAELEQASEQTASLQAKWEAAEKAHMEAVTRAEEAERKVQDLQAAGDALRAEMQQKDLTLAQQVEDLQKKSEGLEQRDANIRSLTEAAAVAASEHEALQADVADRKAHIQILEAQIAELNAQMEAQHRALQLEKEEAIQHLQEERQKVLAEWEAKLILAAEATAAAQAAHASDKAASEEAAAAAAKAAEDAAQREAVLSEQLAERVRELAEAEECMGYLHAEADAHATQLAAETARSDEADADRTELAAAVAERDTTIATLQQAHAEQGTELQARCKALVATEAELAALTATSAALAAERDRLVADLDAECAALMAAEQLAANVRAELDQHCREAANQKKADQKVLAEERLRADRAERNLGEMRALQAKWEQELLQKDKTNAEQVRVLQAQLAAKQAALAELDVLADAAGAAAAQNSALSTELADKARALADQERKIAAMRDQVESLEYEQKQSQELITKKESEVAALLHELASHRADIKERDDLASGLAKSLEEERAGRQAAESERAAVAEEAAQKVAAAAGAAQEIAATQASLAARLATAEADLADTRTKLADARSEAEKRLREHWETSRSEIGKLKVDLETRKRAVAELSKLKADMKRNGHVSAGEAASLRRSLAQREDELSRMRRASAEPPTLGRADEVDALKAQLAELRAKYDAMAAQQ